MRTLSQTSIAIPALLLGLAPLTSGCVGGWLGDDGGGVDTLRQSEEIDWNNDPNRILEGLDTIDVFGGDLPMSGVAERVPYPGNWWPLRTGGINQRWNGAELSPAEKYDRLFNDWTPPVGYAGFATFSGPGDGAGWQDALRPWRDGMGPAARAEIADSNLRAFDGRDSDGDGDIDESDDWDGLEGWFGHCNGWAAAAITVGAPLHPAYMTTPDGEELKLEISDVKAMLTDAYYSVDAAFLSQRCNRLPDPGCDGRVERSCRNQTACTWNDGACAPRERYIWTTDDDGRVEQPECRDTNPASLYLVATNFLGRHGRAFVIDTTFDWQVWNFPVYRYEITGQREVAEAEAARLVGGAGAGAQYTWNNAARRFASVSMRIWYVSDGIAPHRAPVGHKVERFDHEQLLEFVLELDDDGTIVGGEWIGASKENHPDFVWAPRGTPFVDNDEIRWTDVQRVYQASRSGVIDRKLAGRNDAAQAVQDTAALAGAEPGANRTDVFVHLQGRRGQNSYGVTVTNPAGRSVTLRKSNNGDLAGWWPHDFGAVAALDELADGADGQWSIRVTGGRIRTWKVAVWNERGRLPGGGVADDHGDSVQDATPIVAGARINASIEAGGDHDFFGIALRAGDTLEALTALAGLTDTVMYLYGPDGGQIATNDDFGGTYASRISHVAAVAGTYYVAVRAYGGEQTGNYSLRTVVTPGADADPQPDPEPDPQPDPEPDPQPGDDHGNDAGGASVVTADGQAIAGVIEQGGDADWFKFTAQAGVRYELRTALAGLTDTKLALFAADGSLIAENDDFGGTYASRVVWQAGATGSAFARVTAYSQQQTGAYTLTITGQQIGPDPVPDPGPDPQPDPQPGDDHGDDRDAATVLQPGAARAGSIEEGGDQDWFKVTGVVEGSAVVATTALAGVADTKLWAYDASGAEIAANDDFGGGYASQVAFDAPAGGILFFKVTAYSARQTGGYTLTVAADAPAPAPGPGPDPEPQPGDIELLSESGELSRGQDVFYVIDAPAGANVQVVLTGTNDADLYVRRGARPNLNSYDCRPYRNDSNEACSAPGGDQPIHIMVRAYSASVRYELVARLAE